MQGRFIATAAATAIAALAIGPAAALAAPGSFVDDAVGDFAAGSAQSTSAANPGVVLNRTMTNQPFGAGPSLATGWTADQWTTGSGERCREQRHAHGGRRQRPRQHDVRPRSGPGVHRDASTARPLSSRFRRHARGRTVGDLQHRRRHRARRPRGAVRADTRRTRHGGSRQRDLRSEPDLGFDASLPHTYRIEWSANQVKYYVDGRPSRRRTSRSPLRCVPSSAISTTDSGPGTVWTSLGLSLYPAAGTLESRVRDASGSKVTWGTLTSAATTPPGTSVGFATRTGNTPTPDASWSGLPASERRCHREPRRALHPVPGDAQHDRQDRRHPAWTAFGSPTTSTPARVAGRVAAPAAAAAARAAATASRRTSTRPRRR